MKTNYYVNAIRNCSSYKTVEHLTSDGFERIERTEHKDYNSLDDAFYAARDAISAEHSNERVRYHIERIEIIGCEIAEEDADETTTRIVATYSVDGNGMLFGEEMS